MSAGQGAADREAGETPSAFPHDDDAELPRPAADDDLLVDALWPFCGCSKEDYDALLALYDDLKKKYADTERERQELRRSALNGRESLKYVDLLWTKKALLTLGHYKKTGLTWVDHDKVILKPDYDAKTIVAVKAFQCAEYEKTSGAEKLCDVRRETGWITFPEARNAICMAGIAASDEMGLLLAEWFAYGRVYNKNLGLSSALVDALLTNLKKHLNHTTSHQNNHFYPESYYQDLESRARIFKGKLDGLIEQEKEQIKIRNEDAAREGLVGDETLPTWTGLLERDRVCRTPLQDVK
ncbi:MAG: hypothetical protein HXY21_07435 [Parvularculaceae bacterium]|nr:hypothetical protein [Parvularculaceae bacterium]